MITLLAIAKLNNDDQIVAMIEEIILKLPEFTVLPSIDIPGQQYNTLIRTALPAVGFRSANEGVASVASQWANKLVQTYIVDAAVEADQAVIDAYLRGENEFFAKEASGLFLAALKSLCSQLWYGTATAIATSTALAPKKGFPGAIEAYDPANMEVDATGTGASRSSVWFVKSGEGYTTWVFGENGRIETAAPRQVRLTDAKGNPYDGKRMPLLAHVGASFNNSKNSLARIKNITTAAGKGLTDALLADAWEKIADDDGDWHIFLTKRSLMQLKNSRTATTPSGRAADIPDEWEGNPLHVTTALSNKEAA